MAYFSTNAICLKKKKIRIWAWIKLMINTFNVTLRTCWERCWPPRCGHTRAAQLSLQLLLQPNTIFSVPRGNCGPQLWWAAPPAAAGHSCLSAATLGQWFLPMEPLWLPKLLTGDSRAPQGASAYFVSHLKKRSSSASNSLSERGVLRQGVTLFQSHTMS